MNNHGLSASTTNVHAHPENESVANATDYVTVHAIDNGRTNVDCTAETQETRSIHLDANPCRSFASSENMALPFEALTLENPRQELSDGPSHAPHLDSHNQSSPCTVTGSTSLDPTSASLPRKERSGGDIKMAPLVTLYGVVVSYSPGAFPRELEKYYYQRYSFFSKFDKGIYMDKEGWFSVTPERIARHTAKRCRSDLIIDAFCGCGGNSIQFAFTCQRVIAIDIDPVKVACAKHNARIYSVDHKIEFIQGDFLKLAPRLKADTVFLSPPWGGPAYISSNVFKLEQMKPHNGIWIHKVASRITSNIAYYVPRNTDIHDLVRLAGQGQFCEIEKNYLYGRLKALTSYYGNLVNHQKVESSDVS